MTAATGGLGQPPLCDDGGGCAGLSGAPCLSLGEFPSIGCFQSGKVRRVIV